MAEPMVFTVTPRKAVPLLKDALEAGLVPMLHGSPGGGKSSIIRALARYYRLWLIDHRLSTAAPEDQTGLPDLKDGYARFAPFREIFPLEDMIPPENHDGWLIFFDEFNSGSKSVQASAYKIILDRMVGQHKLHPRVGMAAAGNLATDRAIVNPIGTAMQSRLVHLILEVNFTEWLEDVAYAENYDGRIISYHAFTKGAKLMEFNPQHSDLTFSCPRTWEFMNKLIRGKEFRTIEIPNFDGEGTKKHWQMDDKAPLYAGTVSPSTAVDFINFCRVYEKLPQFANIVADPDGMPAPSTYDAATKWAIIGMLMEHVTSSTFEKVVEYLDRYTSDFQVLFYRGLLVRKPEMRDHPLFRKAMGKLHKYMWD